MILGRLLTDDTMIGNRIASFAEPKKSTTGFWEVSKRLDLRNLGVNAKLLSQAGVNPLESIVYRHYLDQQIRGNVLKTPPS
jgi:hypothetical protein